MYSKGIMWLDDCRIPFVDENEHILKYSGYSQGTYQTNGNGLFYGDKATSNQQGRFTPNLLVCDDMLNDGSVSKSDGRKIYQNEDTNIKNNVYSVGWIRTSSDIKDKGTNSRYYDLDLWFDKMLEKL